jgi:hypothetical protein
MKIKFICFGLLIFLNLTKCVNSNSLNDCVQALINDDYVVSSKEEFEKLVNLLEHVDENLEDEYKKDLAQTATSLKKALEEYAPKDKKCHDLLGREGYAAEKNSVFLPMVIHINEIIKKFRDQHDNEIPESLQAILDDLKHMKLIANNQFTKELQTAGFI